MFASPELQPTLDAVVDALVLRFAQTVVVALADQRGDVRFAAVADRDPARRRVLSMRLRDLADAGPPLLPADRGQPLLSLPLEAHGETIGALNLILAPGVRPDDALLAAAIERCALALGNACRFERERHVALTFQTAALGGELPSTPEIRCEAMYQAGRAEALVGGDWYDAFSLPDGRVVISIGDVAGSGLDAAIAMVNVRQTVRGVAQIHPDPALMLAAADRALRAQHPGRFVTAFVGIVDPVTQRCTYANAGHPTPLVRLPDGVVVAASGRGIPLNLPFEQEIEVFEIGVPPGSLLALYTDGLIESTRDVLAGEARLEDALRATFPSSPEHLARRLYDRALGSTAHDDVALMVVRLQDAAPIRRWRFNPAWSDTSMRVARELRDELAATPLTDAQRLDVELVVSELIGNAVRHAPGTVELLVALRPERFTVHLLDRGPGYRIVPHLPVDLYSEVGRGLFLISQLADAFVVERRPGGGSHARADFTLPPRSNYDRNG